jgi:hypothetical protein
MFILFSLILTSTSYADDFTIIRDGIEYLCSPTQTHPGAPARCMSAAYAGPFSKDEAKQLCEGAVNDSPATCAKLTYAGPFNKSETIEICQRARNNGPGECAKDAFAGPFSKAESIRLCKTSGTLANSQCAKEAYAGPYSKEEAIEMCRSNPWATMKVFKSLKAKKLIK